MIIDCFPFNNEFEVLEIRLNELNTTVDKFVISESTLTHSGTNKPAYLKDKLSGSSFLDSFKHKIILLEPNLANYNTAWARENAQRLALQGPLDLFSEEDIILLSDADEIPSTNFIASRKFIKNDAVPYLLSKQYFYYYSFKYRKKEQCHGTIAFKKKDLKHNFQNLRDARFTLPFIENSGWHLSFFGSPEQVQNKIQSFAHTEFSHCNNINQIRTNIENGIDIFNRTNPNEELIKEENNTKIPNYVINNIDRYKHLV